MHAHFTEEVIEELSREKKRLGTEHDYAEVISAQPLTDAQKNRLTQLLYQMSGKQIKLKETVDANHNIAGIYLKLGNLIIDGTLSQRLHQALARVKDSLTR